MEKYKLQIHILVLLILIFFTIYTVADTFAKYSSNIDVATVNLSITGVKYWKNIEGTGFTDDTFKEIVNTEKVLTLESMGKSGSAERIKIPITGLEAGLYQLSFNVVMTGSNVRVVDNTKYVYGCTIDGNDSLDRDVGYLWKSVTPATAESVTLTFEVTAAEAAAGTPQYWLWNLSNIGDNSTFHLELTDISIAKTPSPTSTYIDFPSTAFLYMDTSSTDTYTETKAQQSFVTMASYDELVVKAESISGCEHFFIPIKGLTVGKTYTVTFDELTTNMTLGNNTSYDYGAWIDSTNAYTSKNVLYQSGVHRSQTDFPHYCVSSLGSWHNNNSLTFTATATEMYWMWEYAAFTDNMWGNIHLRNVSIFEGSVASVSSLNLLDDDSTLQDDEEIDINSNSVTTNSISNSISNSVSNNETTTSTNMVTNEISNTENSTVNNNTSASTNTTEDNKNEDSSNNTVINESHDTTNNTTNNTVSNTTGEDSTDEISNETIENENLDLDSNVSEDNSLVEDDAGL